MTWGMVKLLKPALKENADVVSILIVAVRRVYEGGNQTYSPAQNPVGGDTKMTSIAFSTTQTAAVHGNSYVSRSAPAPRKVGITLWVVQSLLAALFLFAGSMKFIMSVAEMTKQIPFPAWFLYFIGTAEVLGALGLVLPSVLRIKPVLTPIAAAGLVIIMLGATVTTLFTPAPAGAAVPFIIGLLAAFVVYGRTRLAPIAG